MSHDITRLRTLVISLILIAFVAGIAAGVAGDRMLTPRVRVRADLGGGGMSAVFDRLDLSTEQRRQAEAIVARSAPRSEAIMLDVAVRLRSVADSVDAELRAILTPEQRTRLDSLRKDSRVMLKRKIVTPGGTRVDTLLDTNAARRR
jgi:Spy/CpxP family protein refolding chaperone